MINFRDTGQGLPVVLLHAFANDSELWDPQFEALSGRFRIIAPDMRGFGKFGSTNGEMISMDRYAEDVLTLLEHLRIERFVVGGISMGGYVALSIALSQGKRVLGLILANTRAGADDPDWTHFREELARDIERRGPIAIIENYGLKPFRSRCPQEVVDKVRRMIARQPSTGLVSATLGMASRPDRISSLGRIEAPTLVISGAEDRYIPLEDGEVMSRGISGSKLVVLPNGGHLSNIDSAAEFNAALSDFLDSLGKEARQ